MLLAADAKTTKPPRTDHPSNYDRLLRAYPGGCGDDHAAHGRLLLIYYAPRESGY